MTLVIKSAGIRLALALVGLGSVVALGYVLLTHSGDARVQVAPELPRYVIYYNSDASPASALVGLPYTHIVLSFVTLRSVTDGDVILQLSPKLDHALDQIAALKADGKKVLISFGGGAMPGADYVKMVDHVDALADALVNVVTEHGFDGVDIDFEISEALHVTPPDDLFDGKTFLIDLTLALRKRMGEGPLLTHAPQPPYLDPDWHAGPYLEVLKQAGDAIDWIAVQYYNNPGYDAPLPADIVGLAEDTHITFYTGIATGLARFSWSPEKTLVALPVYHADAANGHLPPGQVMNEIVCPLVARFGDKFGGLAGWQFSTLTPDHQAWNQDVAGAFTGDNCTN